MEKDQYTTILEDAEAEIDKIKGSRFIGRIYRINDKDEAERKLDEVRKRFYDATHNCFAYTAGIGDGIITRSSDDGEPSGTAGRPILAVLEGSGLSNVLLVVTRYYGGTNLGTGGLIKAYTEAAKAAVETAQREIIEIKDTVRFAYDYTMTSLVMNLINKYGASVFSEEFGSGPVMNVKINRGYVQEFTAEIFERSNGSIKAETC